MTFTDRSHLPGMSARWGATAWMALLALILFLLTGCADAYTLPPLSTNHPAHPEAMAAPQRPPSNTLSYGPSDIPAPQPASYMAQHQTRGTHLPEAAHRKTVVGEGKVIAVVPSTTQIVLDHGEIKGFMDAMTMGYRIDSPSLLEGLQAGDHVRFTIDTQTQSIVKIDKLNP